jgi:hypothetical protein
MEKSTPTSRITYMTIDDLLTNGKSLKLDPNLIDELKVAHCEPFMSNHDLESIVGIEKVKLTLEKLMGPKGNKEAVAEYVVQRAPRVFLALISTRAKYDENGEPCIKLLQEADFTDRSLPIRTLRYRHVAPGDDPYEVFGVESEGNPADEVQPLTCFSGWDPKDKLDYETFQWRFLAPTFEESQFSYEFHQPRPMPFVYIPDTKVGRGAFGTVRKLGLHINHQRMASFTMVRYLCSI